MKILITTLALFISAAVSAQRVYVYPTVFNMGNSAQVQIYNNTEHDIDCSGPIYLYPQEGGVEYNYYSDFIRKGSFSTRFFYLRNFQGRVSYTSHQISCRQAP